MKKIKIGKENFRLCESLEDISYSRGTVFQQYIAKLLYSTDIAIFQETFEKYKKAIDEGRHSEGLILWLNFEQAQLLQKPGVDSYGYCFALIVLDENEIQDENNLSEDFLTDKLKKWEKLGLKRSTVEDVVVNFTSAFPSLYLALRVRMEGLNNLTKIY